MEHLEFRFSGGSVTAKSPARLVGVVASGNLEVLVENTPLGGACVVEIDTAAQGFAAIWQAVVSDFFARHPLADVRVAINDNGATPAVVALRLDQAIAEFTAAKP